MALFESLQNSAFTEWILGSESIWAYPTILTLHTIGLASLVGASAILQLRVLGVGATIPFGRLRVLYAVVWGGFVVNLLSGVALFITQAADRVLQPLFYVKLGAIAIALWLGQEAKHRLFDSAAPSSEAAGTRPLLVLGLWVVAIVAGRLMAYYSGS